MLGLPAYIFLAEKVNDGLLVKRCLIEIDACSCSTVGNNCRYSWFFAPFKGNDYFQNVVLHIKIAVTLLHLQCIPCTKAQRSLACTKFFGRSA